MSNGDSPRRRRDNSRQREATRRAREARAERQRAREIREDQIEAALAAYFAAAAEVDSVRGAAQRKAEAVLAEGERAAAGPYAAACAALVALRDLLGSNGEVAELCGLRAEDVRDMLAAAREAEPTRADGLAPLDEGAVEPDGVVTGDAAEEAVPGA